MPAMLLGAYSDLIAVPERIVARNAFLKPPEVSYTEGAFLEPLACVTHSLAMLAPRAGERIAVLGNGGFGILHALALKARGIEAMLFGRRPERLALARDLGLQSLDSATQPIADAILERTEGRGADAVLECTGSASMWEDATIARAARRPRLVLRRLAGRCARDLSGRALALRRGASARAVPFYAGGRPRGLRSHCGARAAARASCFAPSSAGRASAMPSSGSTRVKA